jgi:SAM-dependent methyltransferase
MPGIGNIWALVVDDEGCDLSVGTEEQELPDWVPKEWLNPVMGDSDVCDVYGAIGVWPASFTVAELLHRWVLQRQLTTRAWRCIEIGSGAGFPSLVAARLGATVLAVDLEPLPLSLLEAAFAAQRRSGCIPDAAALETRCGRAEELSLEGADVIVVSDLLYSVELGHLMGQLLGNAVRGGKCRLLLTDGNRSGSAAFLDTFEATLGSPASFEEFQVPAWAPNKEDLFDGKECRSVRILHY